MCGIVGFVGKNFKVKDVVDSLKRLEYRGYDSAGIAYIRNGELHVFKSVGKIDELRNLLGENLESDLNSGIAHTRWATHGAPNDMNAHPHTDCTGKVAIVHNGIIENFRELKALLEGLGHVFKSDTDTEVIAHLIEEEYRGNLLEAVLKAVRRLDGAYAIGVVHSDHPDVVVAARRGSPLVIGIGSDFSLLASDITPMLRYTKKFIFLEDGDIALLKGDEVQIFRTDGESVRRATREIDWSESAAEKGGYKHFMIKEIMEGPQTLVSAMTGRMKDGIVSIPELEELKLSNVSRINVVACGTSYHAAVFFKYFVEQHTDIDISVEVASEFRYRRPHVDNKTLTLAISQSGETADTLESIRLAKRLGSEIMSITNVVGSTITRESDISIMMNSGPEIGVAATKTYVAQLAILTLLGLQLVKEKGSWSGRHKRILDNLIRMPELFENVLSLNDQIRDLATKYKDFNHFMYIGRSYGYVTALEGALKLKEISYIHAESYPAGELKHGPIALLDPQFPVFAVVPSDSLYLKMKSNLIECKARNARIVALGTGDNEELKNLTDDFISVPRVVDELYPLIMAPVIQLFAYHVADLKGYDPDKPRNLAKSVTVE